MLHDDDSDVVGTDNTVRDVHKRGTDRALCEQPDAATLVRLQAIAGKVATTVFGGPGVNIHHDDLVQEGVIAAWLKLQQTSDHSMTFLGYVMRNRMVDIMRKQGDVRRIYRGGKKGFASRQTSLEAYLEFYDDEGVDKTPVDDDGDYAQPLIDAELNEVLTSMINRLPPRHAEVIRRYYWGRQKMSAIAEDMGISESRVSQLRRHAIRLMREVEHDMRML